MIMTNGVNGAAVWKAVVAIVDGKGNVSEAAAGNNVPGSRWKSAGPSQLRRWSKSELAKAETYWKSLGSTALVIVEDGTVIRAWGDVAHPIQCYSVRKSFLSVLYGIYNKQ